MKDGIVQYVRPQGSFIWIDEDEPLVNSYYMLRREFDVGEFPAPFTLHISALKKYRLSLNGQRIGQGPPPSMEYANICDSYDVSQIVSTNSTNCLAAELQNMEGSASAYFVAWLTDGGDKIIFATSPEWKICRSPMWARKTQRDACNSNNRYQESYDARRVPEGWMLSGFDDSDWSNAVAVSKLPLILRDIPMLEEKVFYAQAICNVEEAIGLHNRSRPEDLSIGLSLCGKPLKYSLMEKPQNLLAELGISRFASSIEHLDRSFRVDGFYDPCVVLDFGQVMTGYIEFDLEGCGGTLDVGYSERLVDGHFVNDIEVLHCSDRYSMRDGRQQYRFYAWKSFRYVKLRFRDCFSPITVFYLRAMGRTYPYQMRGTFQSSDKQMNKLFEICRHTLRLCSNDFVMDTPWREQGQWLGDTSAVLLGGIYSCFGDVQLPGKFLWQTGLSQLPHGLVKFMTAGWGNPQWTGSCVDYTLWWVDALWNHYEYTGNEAWISRYYPHVCKLVYALADQLDEYGLLGNFPYRLFVDWALIDGVDWLKDCTEGQNAFINAQFYGIAEKIIAMARHMGDQHMAAMLEDIRQGIKNSFHTRLFDPDKGAYVDANFDGEFSRRVSEHSNMSAILWGLCDGDAADDIIRRLFIDKTQPFTLAEPYATAFTLRALDRVGRCDIAFQIMRERWGVWMVDKGFTSTTEEWGMNGSWRLGHYTGFMRTLSHAWSAGPAQFLIQNTIGLKILEPGCGRVSLAPKDIGIDYHIACPVPQGEIVVEWKNGKVTVTLPSGVERLNMSNVGE